MKEITPMKRFSAQLDTLKSTIAPYFRSYSLNKSRGHYNPLSYTYSKGVESDFLLIFESLKSDASFAFRFNYIDLDVESQTIETSIKREEDDIISVPALPLSEFKERLKLFVKTVENTPRLVEKNVWDTLCATFDIQPKDINKVVSQAQTTYTENIKERKKSLNIPALEKTALVARNALDSAEDKLNAALIKSDEQKLVAELEAKLKRARALLEGKKKSLKNELDIPKLTLHANTTQKAVDNAQYELEQYEKQQRNALPKHVSKRLKY